MEFSSVNRMASGNREHVLVLMELFLCVRISFDIGLRSLRRVQVPTIASRHG